MKYQDAKSAWHRIFQPDSHAAPEEGTEREERSANGQPTRKKRTRATGGKSKRGSMNSTKTRKLDYQKVPESGDTNEASHWSGTMGKKKVGKEQGSKGRQAQPSGLQCNNKRQPAQINGDYQGNTITSHNNPVINGPKMQINITSTITSLRVVRAQIRA
jgi:hypothetical protein